MYYAAPCCILLHFVEEIFFLVNTRYITNCVSELSCDLIRFFIPPFRILDEREEPGFLTGLKIPAPWAAGKTVETVHPVRDNYKFKETVHIPGARCLYLRFDSRCSSQYDYDKVPTQNSLTIATMHLHS